MRIGRWNIEFYNTRKHQPVIYGIDHLAGWQRDCRPFARSDIQAALMMITNRLQNIYFSSDKDFQVLTSLFEFLKANALRLLLSLFYDGTVELSIADPFNVKFVTDGERIKDERHIVRIYDNIYKATGKTQAQNLAPQIELLNVTNDSDLNLIMNYGAMGILSPENSSRTDGYLDEQQVTEIQDDYRTKYGVRFGKWALLITRTPVKFQRIDLPIAELELSAKRKDAIACILQYLNIPKELHAMFESAKYANRNEAELDIYTNCITSWANKFIEIAQMCYSQIALYNNLGITYPQDVELWFDIIGVPALNEKQYIEKQRVREELQMWQELKVAMPEKADVCNMRIENLIEQL